MKEIQRIRESYFNWLVDKIITDEHEYRSNYTMLFSKLFDEEYYWTIPRDINRAADGVALRERFSRETGEDVAYILDVTEFPCTVLEMMLALAMRCEFEIMSSPDLGDRTDKWFWTMIVNLGLASMDDYNYDEENVNYILYRWLDGNVERNGGGGPFVISNPNRDMRFAELWYQANWYLCEITEGENDGDNAAFY